MNSFLQDQRILGALQSHLARKKLQAGGSDPRNTSFEEEEPQLSLQKAPMSKSEVRFLYTHTNLIMEAEICLLEGAETEASRREDEI